MTPRTKAGTLARHTNPDTKQTLQKSLPCSDASGTHSASVDTVRNLTDREEGRTHNMGPNGGRLKPCFNFLFFNLVHIQFDIINLATCKSSTFIDKFSFS